MRRLVALAVLLAACGGNQTAGVMCEQFIEDRIGASVEFDTPEIEEVSDNRYVVRSTFVDTDSSVVSYECEVSVDGDQWALIDLTTDR